MRLPGTPCQHMRLPPPQHLSNAWHSRPRISPLSSATQSCHLLSVVQESRAGICVLFWAFSSPAKGVAACIRRPSRSTHLAPSVAVIVQEPSQTPRPRRARAIDLSNNPTTCLFSLGEPAQGQTPPILQSKRETMSQSWRGRKGPQR